METLPEACHGPKMQALPNDNQRRFAWLLACGAQDLHEAARSAGYSDPGGESSALRVTVHRLKHDPGIREAVREASRFVLLDLAPLAIRAARNILEDKKHPSHGRMIETILDRTGHFAKTEHKVTVEHTVDVAELEALARRLAGEAGIPVERLIGTNDPEPSSKGGKAPKVIEHDGSTDTPADLSRDGENQEGGREGVSLHSDG